MDSKHELSIYALKGVKNQADLCRELSLSDDPPRLGEPVLSISASGAPRFFGPELSAQNPGFMTGTFVEGVKRAKFWDFMTKLSHPFLSHGDGKVLMVGATKLCIPGYSGGPWLNSSGKVVGIGYGHIRGIFSSGVSIAEQAKFVHDDLDLIRSERAKSGGVLAKTIRIE